MTQSLPPMQLPAILKSLAVPNCGEPPHARSRSPAGRGNKAPNRSLLYAAAFFTVALRLGTDDDVRSDSDELHAGCRFVDGRCDPTHM